jgi:hypothetical protein
LVNKAEGFEPSAALVKAVLINSARPVDKQLDSYGVITTLTAPTTNIPDNIQVRIRKATWTMCV